VSSQNAPPKHLLWEFDGTLAHRPGGWAGAIREALELTCGGSEVSPERIRPHLQQGFPWHAPERTRPPRGADAWWDELQPVHTRAAELGASVSGESAPACCSAELGVEKPNPLAFEHVFRLCPEARQGWFIGDSWHADVQGAAAVGMRAILMRRSHPEARHRCATLDEVVALVSAEPPAAPPRETGGPR